MEKKKTFGELIKGSKPVLVDFYAEWCGPCKAMSPIIQEISKEVGEDAHIIKVDIDKNPSAAQSFEIMGVPTFMIFKEGEIKWRHSGMMPKSKLQSVLESHR